MGIELSPMVENLSVCQLILVAEYAQVETDHMTFYYSFMMLIQQCKLVISRV
jgi:hypothetical protein